MPPKRVAIEASSMLRRPGRFLGGIGRTVLELVRAMVALHPPEELVLFSQRLRGERLDCYGFDVKHRHLSLPRWKTLEKVMKSLGVIEMMCKADLYHAPANCAPLKQLDHTIVTLHDAMFLTYPEQFLGHDAMARTVPEFVRKCRAVITCSNHSKKDIIDSIGMPSDRVHVIYWGTNPEHFHPQADRDAVRERLRRRFGLDRPYYLSVSCDVGRKNTERLIRVYESLAAGGSANDLVLAWRNPPESIRDRCTGAPLAGRVHFLAGPDDEQLADLYRGATAMAFPSVYEGFGLPVLEALSCGTPVITSKVTSMPEVGGNAAIYVDPLSDESIRAALELFENSDPTLEGIRERSLAQAARFSWEQCARQTLDVYRMYAE